MSFTRRRFGPRLACALAGALLATAAAETTGAEPASRPPPPPSAVVSVVTADAAHRLCSMIEPYIAKWLAEDTVSAAASLETLVEEWSLADPDVNAAVLQDLSVVDTATTRVCPGLHTAAVAALRLPDLASAVRRIPPAAQP